MNLKATAEQFEKDGYAVIPDFLDDNEVTALRQEIRKIVDDFDTSQHCTFFCTTKDQTSDEYFMTSGDKIRCFFEKDAIDSKGNLQVNKEVSLNKVAHALHAFNPVFKRITFSEKMKNVARALGLVDPIVCQSMYIFKQPRIGGAVVPHQDSTFIYTDPMTLTGFWLALEDVTIENSCLWFIPGSHKEGLFKGRRMIKNPDSGPGKPGTIFNTDIVPYEDLLKKNYIPVEVKKGTLVLIHGEVVHKSENNLSAKTRHVYAFHMYDQNGAEYSPQNWLQRTDAKTFTPFYTYA